MPLELRSYQESCVGAHFNFFHKNKEGMPLFVIPTGGGKSLVIAEFVRRVRKQWADQRVLILTHVRELIRQNYDEFIAQWGPDLFLPAGIYSAGMKRRDTRDGVIFAGIQSVYSKAEQLGHFDLVLIDEVDLVPKAGNGMYRTYLAEAKKINPALRVCGYTATHFRLDGGYLHKGNGCIFTDVAYEVQLETLIEGGWLVPPIAKRPRHVIDTQGLRKYKGDFKPSELEVRARADGCVEAAVAEAVAIGRDQDRKAWMFFAVTKQHASDIRDALHEHGVDARMVFGDTPKDERDQILSGFKSGEISTVVNVGVATRGYNAPRCDMLVVMRPTESAALYVQIMGRGMRPYPGKKDCLVLDYGLNVARHGPINKVRPRHFRGDGSEKSPPPVKVCPKCQSIILLGTRICPDCGHQWPDPEIRIEHERVAAWESPFDPEANKPRIMKVSSWFFRKHEKTGKPPSLRVDFHCGMRTITSWVCLEHEGFARVKAFKWWTTYHGAAPVPMTVADAIQRQHELRMPEKIEVVDDGRYERVRRPIYEDKPPEPEQHEEAAEADIPF